MCFVPKNDGFLAKKLEPFLIVVLPLTYTIQYDLK
ncbi:MAG: hypothetical protein JWQ40_617 [Segetibacter sp.]|nr:hypothetical protein [Segetibacter sp.]